MSMLRTWRDFPSGMLKLQSRGLTARLIAGFASIIAIGTILLILPISSRTGLLTSPVNALFTATSAVCVTGLVVVDTGTYWSSFGQGVILALFQIGGFGFMTTATILLWAAGRRIGFRDRFIVAESLGLTQQQARGMVRLVRRMATFTILTEGIGAAVLYFHFLAGSPAKTAVWKAIFHSVSAFNNCGIDTFGNFRSLMDYQRDTTVLLTLAGLIILGGISYLFVDDALVSRRFTKLSVDSKMILTTTLSLLALGTMFILLAESSNPATLGMLSFPRRLLLAFFQSVTPRTAGFAAIDMSMMVGSSLFFTMFLMLVGGASGSTAGGIKINTFAVLISSVLSSIRGKEHAEAFGRELTDENVYRALALVMLYIVLVMVVALVLSMTERFRFVDILFETFSAFGNVGLSLGITPHLSVAGRLVISASEFIGRLGPLTIASALIRGSTAKYQRPKAIVRVG